MRPYDGQRRFVALSPGHWHRGWCADRGRSGRDTLCGGGWWAARDCAAWSQHGWHGRCGADDLEIAPPNESELRDEFVIVPALVGRAGDVPVRAVVRDEHAVRLHRPQDHLQVRREAANRETRLEA